MNANIWIVNQFANTPDLPGHIRQYEIGQYLCEQSHLVEIFSSDYNLAKRQYLKLKPLQALKIEKYTDLTWNWLYATPYQDNDWRRYVNMLSFCFTLLWVGLFKPKPDLIIGSSPQLLAAFTAWVLAKLKGAYFYFEVRDIWPQVLIELGGKSPQSSIVRFLSWIERLLYQNSDRVIVLAAGVVDYVQKRGATEVAWLPNGPELEQFRLDLTRDQAKQKYNIPLDKTCLIYTGAHGKANALETLVEAGRLLEREHPRQFLILLVGDGPEKLKLLELAREIHCIEFREPVPKSAIPELLQAADGLIITLKDIPLFHYGVSPNKLYDYYAAGKPVIVAVGGTVNQEVEENQLGLTAAPENARELSQKIFQFSQLSQSEREAMGERGVKLVQSTYARSKVASKLLQLIQDDLTSLQ